MQQFKRGDSIGIRFLWVLLALLPPAAAAQRLERDGLVFDGVSQIAVGAGPERYRADEARFVDWLPDGSLLVLAGPAGQLQLQRLPTALAPAEPQPIAGDRILQAITPDQGAAALAPRAWKVAEVPATWPTRKVPVRSIVLGSQPMNGTHVGGRSWVSGRCA